MKMQLQILLEVYFCTDAVFDLVQFVTFWYGISSSIVCKFFSWCPTFRSTLVFSKSATIRNNIVENPSFQPDLQAMLSTVHKLCPFFQHFQIVHFLFSCIHCVAKSLRIVSFDWSGNTVWPQAFSFQKLAKNDHFWHF